MHSVGVCSLLQISFPALCPFLLGRGGIHVLLMPVLVFHPYLCLPPYPLAEKFCRKPECCFWRNVSVSSGINKAFCPVLVALPVEFLGGSVRVYLDVVAVWNSSEDSQYLKGVWVDLLSFLSPRLLGNRKLFFSPSSCFHYINIPETVSLLSDLVEITLCNLAYVSTE